MGRRREEGRISEPQFERSCAEFTIATAIAMGRIQKEPLSEPGILLPHKRKLFATAVHLLLLSSDSASRCNGQYRVSPTPVTWPYARVSKYESG